MKINSDREKEYIKEKEWMYQGETTAHERPLNSLVNCDIEFRQAKAVIKQDKSEEDKMKLLVKERLRENRFDNYVFEVENGEKEPEEEIKANNNIVMDNEEIEETLNMLNIELMKISDLNNNICEYETVQPMKKKNDSSKRLKKGSAVMKELKKHKNVEIIK